jgi:hypothetical protein
MQEKTPNGKDATPIKNGWKDQMLEMSQKIINK